jgi:hypothetical protein
MCSILKRAAICIIGSSGLLAGCQRMTPPQPDGMNRTPLVVDDAMQKRDWDRQTIEYPSGATVAGGTGYLFRTSDKLPELWWRIVDPMVATDNILPLPVGVFFNPPWKPFAYRGAIVPASYTAFPQVPDDEAPQRPAR